MRYHKLLKKISILTTSIIGLFCLCACPSGDDSSADLKTLVPDTINTTAIDNIPGYDELIKSEIIERTNVSIENGIFPLDEDTSVANEFLATNKAFGKLSAFSDSCELIDFNDQNTISFYGSILGFSFLQDVSKKYEIKGKEITISDSNQNNVGSYSVGDSFHSGAFLVLKSFDNSSWEREAYMTSINRTYVTYMPNSSDVNRGVYYKFYNSVQFSFLSHYEEKSSGILWWKSTSEEPVYSYFNVVQTTTVFIAKTSLGIRFYCESFDSIEIEDEELSSEELDIIHSSTTMTNGSVSFSTITAEIYEETPNTYQVNYVGESGEEHIPFNSTKTFTKPGRYEFVITNILGVEQTITLYIVDIGDDNGISLFFGSGIIDSSMRVFEPTKSVQTYMVGKTYCLKEIPAYAPGLYGNILYSKDENSIQNNQFDVLKTFENNHDVYSGTFSLRGFYIFDLFTSDPSTSSGDIAHFVFTFFISNDTSYAPSVNQSLLSSPLRSNVLATKVYVVTLPTTGGGAYQFVYPYSQDFSQEAYDLAVEIEELSVEIVEDSDQKVYYYKSHDNPNIKVAYTSKLSLYNEINYYADKNIGVAYLEGDVPFAQSIVEEDELSNLSENSLRTTVRLVRNENVLFNLRTGELYLNDFQFTQVADFEVDSVSFIKENNETVSVGFDESLDSMFSKNEKVLVVEHNWNKENKYEAIYSKNNSCQLAVRIGSSSRIIDLNSNGEHIYAESFRFISVTDMYDSQTLITVDNGSVRTVFSMNEINGLDLPSGYFTITVSNRNKQSYKFTISCDGKDFNEQNSIFNYNHDEYRKSFVPASADGGNVVSIDTKPKSHSVNVWVLVVSILGTAIVCILTTALISNGVYQKRIASLRKGKKSK